jgi:uncharacterized protein (DUF2141 family)
VHVSGVAAGKGKINVAVCDKEPSSSSAPTTARCRRKAMATMSCACRRAGRYAGPWWPTRTKTSNDELDRNFVGIPKENYGFSRDARSKFGPPGFEDAAIEVGGELTMAKVTLR